MAKHFLCRLDEVATDALREVNFGGDRKVCVINAAGTFYACQSACPHEGIRLCEGCVDGTTLTCLEHLWQWDLNDGSPLGLAEKPLAMFKVETEDDSLFLTD
jgi:toluene monooxygenase system ferredoxin subunit